MIWLDYHYCLVKILLPGGGALVEAGALKENDDAWVVAAVEAPNENPVPVEGWPAEVPKENPPVLGVAAVVAAGVPKLNPPAPEGFGAPPKPLNEPNCDISTHFPTKISQFFLVKKIFRRREIFFVNITVQVLSQVQYGVRIEKK